MQRTPCKWTLFWRDSILYFFRNLIVNKIMFFMSKRMQDFVENMHNYFLSWMLTM